MGRRGTWATETQWVPIDSFGTHRITIARRGVGHQSLESDAITVAIRVPGFPGLFHVCPCRGPVGSSRSSTRPHRAAGDPRESGGHLRDDRPPLRLMCPHRGAHRRRAEGGPGSRHASSARTHLPHASAARALAYLDLSFRSLLLIDRAGNRRAHYNANWGSESYFILPAPGRW